MVRISRPGVRLRGWTPPPSYVTLVRLLNLSLLHVMVYEMGNNSTRHARHLAESKCSVTVGTVILFQWHYMERLRGSQHLIDASYVYNDATIIFSVILSIKKPSQRDLYNLETKLHYIAVNSTHYHCLETEQNDFILMPLRCSPHSQVYPKLRFSQVNVCQGPQLLTWTSEPRVSSGDCNTSFQEGKVSVR